MIRSGNKRTTSVLVGSALVWSWAAGPVLHAATIIDDFNDGSISNTIWTPPPTTEEDGALTEQNGRLEFTGSSSTAATNSPRGTLGSTVSAPQNRDWLASIDVFIDGLAAFSGFGPGNVVVTGMGFRPTGTTSDLNGSDRGEMNFALLDAGFVGGSGFQTGARFLGRSNDTDDEVVELKPDDPLPRTATLTLFYDADSTTFREFLDLGPGFLPLGNPINTTSWGMDGAEVFFFELEAFTGPFDGSPTHNYSVDSGEVFFDDFSLIVAEQGQQLSPPPLIPEPSTGLVLLAAAVAALRRWRRPIQ